MKALGGLRPAAYAKRMAQIGCPTLDSKLPRY